MDYSITWLSERVSSNSAPLSDVFSEVGVAANPKSCKHNTDINLDVVVSYKSTTIKSIAEYLLSKVNTGNYKADWAINFVSCIIFECISFKGTSVTFFEDDEFHEFMQIFEKVYGETLLRKEKIAHIENADKILSVLCRKGVLRAEGDCYYVVGHILKCIHIEKIQKNNK